jgi:hypothetical protein
MNAGFALMMNVGTKFIFPRSFCAFTVGTNGDVMEASSRIRVKFFLNFIGS